MSAGDEGAISVRRGERVVLDLDSNPTTGYRWEAEFDPALLRLAEHRYVPGADRPGAGGRQHFEFEGLAVGAGALRFFYRSSWRAGTPRQQEYNVTVEL
ncbi:MAG: protease inhibitor I42 family protein [Thermoplasmata archaeon]|nr:protease inhibitor I42 family protein [Thermoplasmata archaeon]